MTLEKTFLPSSWYLIQRLAPAYDWARTNQVKLDRYFSCDYMGSAEFEFGALPASIKLLRTMAAEKNLSLHEMSITAATGKTVVTWVICHKDANVPSVANSLTQLANFEGRQKELTHYDRLFCETPQSSSFRSAVGWFVLDRDFPLFFFTSELMKTEVWGELTDTYHPIVL